MTNRELETRYMQMKLTWKNLVNANVDLVDENKILKEEIERLKEENNFLKQLIPNDKKYSYGIRIGSDKE